MDGNCDIMELDWRGPHMKSDNSRSLEHRAELLDCVPKGHMVATVAGVIPAGNFYRTPYPAHKQTFLAGTKQKCLAPPQLLLRAGQLWRRK